MNNKVLAAFVGGLLVASGITYVLMKRPEPGPVSKLAPVAATRPSEPAPETKASESPTAAPKEDVQGEARTPGLQPAKPEPARPAARSQAPVSVASRTRPSPIPEAPKQAESRPATNPAPAPPPVETARTPEPTPAPATESAPPMMPKLDPPAPKPNTVTIPAGTNLMVRLGEKLSTERNRPGDTFSATLDQPLVVDGFVIAERGARAQGRVVESDRSGRVRGVALMQVELTQIATADGQRVKVNTAFVERKADPSRKNDAAKVGIGAAIGAAIGAIAGGGKGAAVGAGVGGAAGVGDVLLTRGKEVEFPVESRLTFRLAEAITLTERLR